MRVAAYKRVNATISCSSIGIMAKAGDLVLVREASSTCSREGCGNKVHHEKYTGPWTIKVLQTGLSVEVELRVRRIRKRTVTTSSLKPFTVRPLGLRYWMVDKVVQYAWETDYNDPRHASTDRPPPCYVHS